jgi:acetylornithine aminotransferase
VPLVEENGFLPDLDALDPETLSRTAIFWLNYPNNPTAAVAPLALYERAARLAAEYDFLLASDEAYSELWFHEPPPSALQVRDRSNVVAFNTLSKRSSMTGYRSGFVAGPGWVMDALRAYRPTVGTAPQEFVQRAAVAAWSDEEHVSRARDVYRRKREVLLGALETLGWRVAGSDATMYLWVEVPAGESSEECAERLLAHGIVVAPGAYLGASGEGYVRMALVPTVEDCERAAAILRGLA